MHDSGPCAQFLNPHELARIASCSAGTNLETERAAKALVGMACKKLGYVPWVLFSDDVERPGRGGGAVVGGVGVGVDKSFKRLLRDMNTSRIVMLGGEGELTRVDVMDLTGIVCGVYLPSGIRLSQAIKWELVAPMPFERAAFGAAWRRGEIIAVGRGTAERYDSLSRKWTPVSQPMPKNFRGVSAAMFNDKIYVTGGFYANDQNARITSNAVYTLEDAPAAVDPAAATWVLQEGKLNIARHSHAQVFFDGKLWVAGGVDGNRNQLSSVEVLNPVLGLWERKPSSMAKRRAYFQLVVASAELYAVGGDTTKEGITIEKLDSASQTWKVVADYDGGGPRFACASTSDSGSCIFLLGGDNRQFSAPNSTFDFFDTVSCQFLSAYMPPEARQLPRSEFRGGQVCLFVSSH